MAIDFSKYAEMDSGGTTDFSKYAEMDSPKKPANNQASGMTLAGPAYWEHQLRKGMAEGFVNSVQELGKKLVAFSATSTHSMPTKGEKPADFAKRTLEPTKGTTPTALPQPEGPAQDVGRTVGSLPAGFASMADPAVAAVVAGGGLAQHGTKGIEAKDVVHAGAEVGMAAVPGATAGMGLKKAVPLTGVMNYILARVAGQDNKSAVVSAGIGSVLTAAHGLFKGKPAVKAVPEVTPTPEVSPAAPPVQKMIEAPGGGTMGTSRLPGKETLQLPAAPEGAFTAEQVSKYKLAGETYRQKGLGIESRKVSPRESVQPVPRTGEADPIQIAAQVKMDAARKKLIDGLLGKLEDLRSAPETQATKQAFDTTMRKLRAAGWNEGEKFVPTRLREQTPTELPEPPPQKPPTEPVKFQITKDGIIGSPQTPEDVEAVKKWMRDRRASRVEPVTPATTEPDHPILPRATVGNWFFGAAKDHVHGIIKRASPAAAEEFWKKATDMHGSTSEFRGAISGAGGDEAQALSNHVNHLGKPTQGGGSALRDLLEGKVAPRNAKEAKFADLVWSVQKKTGEIAKSLGLMSGNPDGKLRIQFVTGKAKELIRENAAFRDAWTNEMVRLNEARPEIIARAAKAKQSPSDFVRKLLDDRAQAAAESPVVMPTSSRRKIAAELTRELVWPDYVSLKGKPVEVLESNPHNYVSKLIEQYSQRFAFVKHFEANGGFEKYLQSVKGQTGGDQKVEAALRAFARKANVVADPVTGFQLPKFVQKAGRAFMDIEAVAKVARLSRSMINQTADLFPGNPMYQWTNKSEVAQAVKNMVTQRPGWTRADLAREGLLTKNSPNESFDPANATSSTARKISNTTADLSGLRMINEYGNEYPAAAFVKMAITRMRGAKTPDQKDIERLVTLGYNTKEAARIAGGGGSAQDYRNVGSELVNRMVSQPTLPTQRAPSEFDPRMQGLFRIGRRWSNEHARRVTSALKGAKILWDQGDKASAARLLKRVGLGMAVGGAGGQMMVNISQGVASGGQRGMDAQMSELKQHPVKAVLEAAVRGNTAGPQSALMDWMTPDQTGSSDIPSKVARSTSLQPYLEAYKMLNGEGKYKNTPAGERAWQFTRGMVPGTKILQHAAGEVAGATGALGGKKTHDRWEAESSRDDLYHWIYTYGDKFKDGRKWDTARAEADLRKSVGEATFKVLVKYQMLPWQKKTKGFVADYK